MEAQAKRPREKNECVKYCVTKRVGGVHPHVCEYADINMGELNSPRFLKCSFLDG